MLLVKSNVHFSSFGYFLPLDHLYILESFVLKIGCFHRAFTAVELRKKLCGKKFSAEIVDEVINDYKCRCISKIWGYNFALFLLYGYDDQSMNNPSYLGSDYAVMDCPGAF